MQRLLLIIMGFIFAFSMTSNSFSYTGFGICNFGKETVPSVICYGPAVLKDTTVSNDLKVAGDLTAVNISAGSLSITGATDIQNSKIKGSVQIIGNLTASNVDFQQGLSIKANKVLLHNVKVKGDVVIDASSDNPELTMECGTLVFGMVKFNGKAGIIRITGDSSVQGKIMNGSMIFEKRKC